MEYTKKQQAIMRIMKMIAIGKLAEIVYIVHDFDLGSDEAAELNRTIDMIVCPAGCNAFASTPGFDGEQMDSIVDGLEELAKNRYMCKELAEVARYIWDEAKAALGASNGVGAEDTCKDFLHKTFYDTTHRINIEEEKTDEYWMHRIRLRASEGKNGTES